ncbi:MAG: branched-chain amino acid ABC transporter permease [Deltaproteobacteria bacterium]|nr:branched-chain amino acid ABC transporter permease [Deltaproteobacteria bacterium]MBW1817576.1 branched-chain amino acid ABC transporter permease [Deltaproteobacteria bacterium]
MINRECGNYKRTYRADMALYPVPLQRYTIMAAVVTFYIIFPLLANEYALNLANLIGIACISAIGLNILTGYTGQISIGHAAFMMVGAYTAAILNSRYGVSFLLCLPAAGIMAAAVGSFFGIPSLRIKGLYLAISTLAAQFIIEWVINHWTWVSGGAFSSIYLSPPDLFGWIPATKDGEAILRYKYYIIFVLLAVAVVFALNLVRSRVGRAFIAIRDNDVSAEIIGINVFRYKITAFALSSFYAGVGGALYCFYYEVATYESFSLIISIDYLAMVIIGGLGSVLGAIYGAIFISLLPIVLDISGTWVGDAFFGGASTEILANVQVVTFGALIIFFLVVEPEGLNKLWRNIKDYFRVWPFSY